MLSVDGDVDVVVAGDVDVAVDVIAVVTAERDVDGVFVQYSFAR